MNELRTDPISGHQVIISGDRDRRPNQFKRAPNSADDGAASCPFCFHQMDTPPVVAEYGKTSDFPWQVCVVPNLFPIFDQCESDEATGRGPSRPVMGTHEVVVESPTHETNPGQLSERQMEFVVAAYRDRMKFLYESGQAMTVLPIKNSGGEAGASLKHCHSQIFGIPFVPDQLSTEISAFAKYAGQHDRCICCDMLSTELDIPSNASRVVWQNDLFVAWCPFASRFGYETWIAPRRHQSNFVSLSHCREFGKFLRTIIQALDAHERIAAFNYWLHSAPNGVETTFHWHLEIAPRTTMIAGFEWGTGIHVNTVDPARAAAELRQQISKT